MKTEFKCSVCKQIKPVTPGMTTGYGYDKRNRKVCFACCGERDKVDMIKEGRAMLYLSLTRDLTDYEKANRVHPCGTSNGASDWQVGNWPGTLKLNAYVTKGQHNIARTRYDAWFTGPDNQQWHGVTYGDNTQICHCRRIKA